MLKVNIKLLIDSTKIDHAHLSPSVDRDKRPCLFFQSTWLKIVSTVSSAGVRSKPSAFRPLYTADLSRVVANHSLVLRQYADD